jgi:hypothetical protein
VIVSVADIELALIVDQEINKRRKLKKRTFFEPIMLPASESHYQDKLLSEEEQLAELQLKKAKPTLYARDKLPCEGEHIDIYWR